MELLEIEAEKKPRALNFPAACNNSNSSSDDDGGGYSGSVNHKCRISISRIFVNTNNILRLYGYFVDYVLFVWTTVEVNRMRGRETAASTPSTQRCIRKSLSLIRSPKWMLTIQTSAKSTICVYWWRHSLKIRMKNERKKWAAECI